MRTVLIKKTPDIYLFSIENRFSREIRFQCEKRRNFAFFRREFMRPLFTSRSDDSKLFPKLSDIPEFLLL